MPFQPLIPCHLALLLLLLLLFSAALMLNLIVQAARRKPKGRGGIREHGGSVTA